MAMPTRAQCSRIITATILAMDRWSRSAAVHSASLMFGSIRKVNVVVFSVAMIFPNDGLAVDILQCTANLSVVLRASISDLFDAFPHIFFGFPDYISAKT